MLMAILALCSCTARKTAQVVYRSFPKLTVPAMYTTEEDMIEYAAAHFWDTYFAQSGVTDSAAVLGVRKAELEQALSNYIEIQDNLPLAKAQKNMAELFAKVEACQQADTSSLFYLRFTEMVERYLYDPNSPMRNEDLFLPFVQKLAECPFTDTLMRTGYRYMARMCSLNQTGSVAPDFTFKDARGRIHSLHGVKAGYTMLFFSNPGCDACRQMAEDVDSCPSVSRAIADGRVALVNIYIDQEIDKWREYEPSYPRSWITGYDWQFTIRTDQSYDVRAIPSLYLLDSEKRVIMKDAPTERVLRYLDMKLMQGGQ